MGNIRFRYFAGFWLTAVLCMGSAFAQSQIRSPGSGKNYSCAVLNDFGYWFSVYVGAGGEAELDTTPKIGYDAQCLYQQNFNFSIPTTAKVTGIYVTFTAYLQLEAGPATNSGVRGLAP
jgi:hypothetical protein